MRKDPQTPLEAARTFAAALRASDREAAAILITEYLPVLERLTREVKSFLSNRSDDARDKRERLEALRVQLVAELRTYAFVAQEVISSAQRGVIAAAIEDAASVFFLSQARSKAQIVIAASWNRAPVEALQLLVGKVADGSTIAEYMISKIGETWSAVRRELVFGLAAGKNPRVVARACKKALKAPLVNTLTTAREALVGTYNEASIEQYRANPELVSGFIRLSALGPRTCALCWALHGKFYPLGEDFLRHLNCRCTTIPVVEGVPYDVELGPKLFAQLGADEQKKILYPGEYALYKARKIGLGDLVAVKESKKWGPTLRRKTLGELEDEAAA